MGLSDVGGGEDRARRERSWEVTCTQKGSSSGLVAETH